MLKLKFAHMCSRKLKRVRAEARRKFLRKQNGITKPWPKGLRHRSFETCQNTFYPFPKKSNFLKLYQARPQAWAS